MHACMHACSSAQKLLSPWSWGARFSRHVEVFKTQKVPKPPHVGVLWWFRYAGMTDKTADH